MNLYIDAGLSGISGDMILALLVGLGGDEDILKYISKETSKILGSEQDIIIRDVSRKGIIAKQVKIKIRKNVNIDETSFKKVLENIDTKEEIKLKALNIFKTLIDAESKIHGNHELHELSSVDTLIDILGSLMLLDNLGIENVFSSTIETGRGYVVTSHGKLPIPTPITLEIMRAYKIPYKSEIYGYELATPTGVAILANIARFELLDEIIPERISYATGEIDLEELPNIARGIMFKKKFKKEYISILETNLDDISGEVVGYLFERLYQEGVLDFHVIQCIGKKSRPCFILRVIVEPLKEEKICNILFKETGTLGIRIFRCEKRAILDRIVKEIKFLNEIIRVKISKDIYGNVINVKPEFEDLKRISKKYNIPIKDLYERIIKLINK